MDIFSANPKSFKLRRKSPVVSELKSCISVNLPQFLPHYADDVLAEYITVLVCHGKHQYQAKEDLEAFLGDRTVEFVSWLWNHISENAGQFSTDSGLCKGAITNRSAEFQSHSTSHADELLMKDDKTYHVTTCAPVSIEDMKLAKDSQHCPSFSALFSEILNQESSGLPKELLHLPKREESSKVIQSVISGRPSPKQICASNNLGSSLLPRFVGTGSMLSDKPRGSVWDRLGKPCGAISAERKDVNFYGVGHMKQDAKVHNQLPLIPLKRNPEIPTLVTRSQSHLVEMKKLEHGSSAVGESHLSNNIGRKRLFGEISADPGIGSVSLVDERNTERKYKDTPQDFKNSNLDRNGLKATPKLVREVLHVKQRLHQVEIEMLKLQSKQVKIEKKDGKIDNLSNSGILEDSEKHIEIESRTVLVTNVHFSATKEALSLFFAKCGVVVNVAMLADVLTSRPKGSAYVTFSSKESVDKAVTLSGTTFYSRIVKVVRKAEEAGSMASSPRTPTQLPFPNSLRHGNVRKPMAIPNKPLYLSSSLQWRRESRADLSSAPVAGGDSSISSAPKHLSGSSTTEPPATASS